MAKTAVVAGTATCNAVNRRSAEKDARANAEAQQEVQGQQVQYAQPAPPTLASQEDTISQLERLGSLKNQGIITEEEF